MLTQKAVLSNVGTNQVFQTTQCVYGVTTSTSGINSNDLLLQVEYPDKSTGNPNTNSAYVESYTYDALGEQTKKTQRTGSVHQYSYDSLGRMTSDNVITLGGAVNGSIRRIDYTYDTGGRLYQATSFSNTSGATIVNQIQRDYNGLGQVVREWQSQTGGVNTTPGTSQTTSVQYTYSELANGTNYANHSRLTSIIYPEGDRTVNYAYNGNSGLDDVISRLSALTQTVGTNSTTLESYDYLGIGTVVAKHHPQNGIDLTYEQQTNDTNAPATNDGGDIYTGLDRFGRIADQNWLNTSTGTNLTSTDRFQYGYDADSNVMYKKNKVSSSNSELYHTNGTNGAYDSLNRLTAFSRGTLNGGNDTISGASATRSWTLDGQGNWSANPSGDTYAVNDENQYTSLTHVTGGCCGGSSSLNFTYDNDGNMTTRVDSSGFGQSGYVADTFAYDAWDRLASVNHTVPSGGGVWTETDFDIDALGRRDQIVVTDNTCTPVPSDNLFYSIDWQVLEDDRATSVNNGVATGWTRNQYVWSPTYVNDLVLRDKDTNHDNTFAERLYVEQDANHNVTAITDTGGNVKERIVYDPYGAQTVLNSSWAGTSDTYTWIYGFQGGRYDSYAGLYNFQRREYDPTLGRWMQQDPAGYVDGKNLYRSLLDAPDEYVDPSGLQVPPPTQPSGFNQFSNVAAAVTTQPAPISNLPPDILQQLQQLGNANPGVRDNASNKLRSTLLDNPDLYDPIAKYSDKPLSPAERVGVDSVLAQGGMSATADPAVLPVGAEGIIHVHLFEAADGPRDITIPNADPNKPPIVIGKRQPMLEYWSADPMIASADIFNQQLVEVRLLPDTSDDEERFRAGPNVGTTVIRIKLIYEDTYDNPHRLEWLPTNEETSVRICVYE